MYASEFLNARRTGAGSARGQCPVQSCGARQDGEL
jgi:hypothetical protein